MFLVHEFGLIDDPEHKRLFSLINAHAPMALADKELYWKTIREHAAPDTIVVGDMNKFSEHHENYKKLFFTDELEDKVGLDNPTFISFPWDSKPDGNPWVSCLDVVITHSKTSSDISVISTHDGFDTSMKNPDKLRPTDHFMIVGHVVLTERTE